MTDYSYSQSSCVGSSTAITPSPTPVVSHNWQNMTRTIAHYTRHEQIGMGTYGMVYRATCRDTGATVAMKKVRLLKSGYIMGMPSQLIREIKILKRLQHPNLLRMIEVVTSKGVEYMDPDDPIPVSEKSSKKNTATTTSGNKEKDYQEDQAALAREKYKGNLFLVLEYGTHDLMGLLDVAYEFEPVQVKCIFRQLLSALEYMHANKYVHRDIKSSNILLDNFYRLKLADFGLARSLEPPLTDQMEGTASAQDLTQKVITLWYRPPEILLGTVNYGCAVDVWSAGCILVELCTGKPMAAGKTELEQLALIADLTGTPDESTWNYLMGLKKDKKVEQQTDIPVAAEEMRIGSRRPSRLREKYGPDSRRSRQIPEAALNLLEKLLEWDPRKRLTAANALQNRYFWTQPVAPDDPAELGAMNVAEGGHFHEFRTKQKRRQAKQHAEVAKEQALAQGATADEAKAVLDQTYQGIMKQVAQEGFEAVSAKEDTRRKEEDIDEDSRKDDRRSRKEEKRGSSRRRRGRDEDRDRKRHREGNASDDERRRHKSRRSEEDDQSIGRDKKDRREKEKRRHSSEERKERKRKEESGDRHLVPEQDDEASGRERRSKASRRGSSASKKDKRRKRGRRDRDKSRDDHRHRDREKNRERRHERGRSREQQSQPRDREDRGRRDEGLAPDHYDPYGPPPPRDLPPRYDNSGPRGDFGSGEEPPPGDVGHYGPRRRERDGPPLDDFGPRRDWEGPPPRRERDGPPLDEFGPRRVRDGPPPRRERDGPLFDDFGPRRDRDGPPHRRERDAGPPFDDFGPRCDRDGPPLGDFGGPQRNWDGPPPGDFGPRRNRSGPGDFGPRRDRGPTVDHYGLAPARDGPPAWDGDRRSPGRRGDQRGPRRDDRDFRPPPGYDRRSTDDRSRRDGPYRDEGRDRRPRR